MADTHPNAYLAEAKEKRDQANVLLAEAESLEEQARALLGEPKAEAVAAEAAAENDEPYDEDNPHRHSSKKK